MCLRQRNCEEVLQSTLNESRPPRIRTLEDLRRIPQSDRMGRKAAFAALVQLNTADSDFTDGNTFPWHLLLANMGTEASAALQDGVDRVILRYQSPDHVVLQFTGPSGTVAHVNLAKTRQKIMLWVD